MPVWTFHDHRMRLEHLGLLPDMLSEASPDGAVAQFDRTYGYGGGWRPFNGFKLKDDNSLGFPGDPPLKPLASCKLRDETVVFYDGAWVAVIQPDRTYSVCRMD